MTDLDLVLKPCPFCGGKAKLMKYMDDRYGIECSECDCKIKTLDGLHSENNAKLALKAWNTRPYIPHWRY